VAEWRGPDGGGADKLVRPALGAAVPTRSRPIGAGEREAPQPPQDAADWARQTILQTKRWLPNRLLILVADNGFAAPERLVAVRYRVCVITRLRLDAALYKPAPPRRKGQRGGMPLKGRRLPTLHTVLARNKIV
jgi:DDE superfamily endonuclease